MFCEGQLLPISENETLFNLIGTTYGGDGQSTFALPDLRGRLPIHQGNSFILAQNGGVETVTLTTQQIPIHAHALLATDGAASTTDPTSHVTGKPDKNLYRPGPAAVPMATQAIGITGGSQPHDNFQPYLCIDFIISLFGVFPTPS
jgi:microcystin-dependent protein